MFIRVTGVSINRVLIVVSIVYCSRILHYVNYRRSIWSFSLGKMVIRSPQTRNNTTGVRDSNTTSGQDTPMASATPTLQRQTSMNEFINSDKNKDLTSNDELSWQEVNYGHKRPASTSPNELRKNAHSTEKRSVSTNDRYTLLDLSLIHI